MTSSGWQTVKEALAGFDEYLRRVPGVCAGTRRNYGRYVGEFLVVRFADAVVEPARIEAPQVVAFVAGLSGRYGPRTVELAASSLRSFFRFLRVEGIDADGRLADAVPMVPHRPSGLVRHLGPADFEGLLASLDSSSPRGMRDRAIILCMARLGLRAGEVVALRLEDIDWMGATVRVRARKTGHGAMLPLTGEVGAAVADYLQQARPVTGVRQVFVLHWLRVGAPISAGVVTRAVEHALDHAGIRAPVRGGNLLRHSLATELLGAGAGLVEIADLLGHSCLATTRIYAAVDLGALAQVPLPWPQASS